MAVRPSVKEILAAARRGGPARPEAAPLSQSEREAGPPDQDPAELADLSAAPEPPEIAPEPMAPAAAPLNVPTPATLGRPLTLKEKLAAARAGGALQPAPAPAAPRPTTPELTTAQEAAPAVVAAAPAPPPDVPTPAELGRPLTLKEKLAAARAGGATAATAPAPSGAKPAASKAAPAAAGAKPAAAARVLPPLEKMSDPRDLAEALRRAGAERQKAAKAEPAKTGPGAKHAAKTKAVPPRPARDAAMAPAPVERRGFLIGLSISSIVLIGWGAFLASVTAFTAMMGRFMFPNVLAEPPSTIKVGLPSNFEKDEVNERWKAEWGFWIVRSAAYNGQDSIYAIQSICTHLGCPPNWLAGEQKFKCPCHGSGFYISGVNFEGPAPRPLERFKIGVGDDGNIVVDKSQKFQEELGQWSDPDSFISA